MNIKTLFLLLALILPFGLLGQGETNNWYFGFNAGLRFNTDGSIDTLDDGQLNTFEGCATISSAEGDLLFYTDGKTVYNRLHAIMQNGTDLLGDPSSTQSALIVPWPDKPNLYYIFTVNTQPTGLPGIGLNYSIVDITLNGGLGAVTQKNTNLLQDCAEKIAAVVKDCNNQALWVVALSDENGSGRPFDTYHAFEISPSGIGANPVKSTFPSLNIEGLAVGGYLKFSSDTDKLASANLSGGLYLYDFDSTTGVISNQNQIFMNAISNLYAYGIEFSPNSNYLYAHASNNLQALTNHTSSLYQFDIQATDISASQIVLDDSRNLYRGALQLGLNGKIYRALSTTYFDGTSFLGAINNPNELGTAANYEHNAVDLNGKNSAQGLPPFVQSFFNKTDLIPNGVEGEISNYEICEGEPLTLQTQNINGASYLWEKDGVEINGVESHILDIAETTLDNDGDYVVTIIRPDAPACPITAKLSVTVLQAKPPITADNVLICDTDPDFPDDGITTIDLTQFGDVQNFTYTYYTSEADRNADNPIVDPDNYRNTKQFDQSVYYTTFNDLGCKTSGEMKLNIRNAESFLLDENYFICEDNPDLTITGPSNFDSYRWYKLEDNSESLVSENETADIPESGTYLLEAGQMFTEGTSIMECASSFAFNVMPSSSAVINDIVVENRASSNTVEIQFSGSGDYDFSLDGSNFQNSNSFEGIDFGKYTTYVRDKNGCGIVDKTFEIEVDKDLFGFPKFFTPNGDGINDYWQFRPTPGVADLDLRVIYIFNRFGRLIAQIDPKSKGWDGTLNGRPLPASDYWFKASTVSNLGFQGHFTLKR